METVDPPPLRFARAPDGTSIAYWVAGSGPAMVLSFGVFYPSVMEHWHIAELRALYSRLAERWTVVAFDWRGLGNSGGEADRPQMEDLEAVRSAAELDALTLVGVSPGADLMVPYALAHPDVVERIVLWNATPSGMPQPIEHLTLLEASHPRLYHETRLLWRGWNEKLSRDQAIDLALRHPLRFGELAMHLGESPLEEIHVPVDVVFSRDSELGYSEPARELASRIPDARLTGLPGRELDPQLGNLDRVMDFFESIHPGGAMRGSTGDAFRTILFTDLVGSTAATQRLGDAAAQDLVRVHNEIVRSALASTGGNEIKHTGDGIMAWFSTASDGLDCAQAIQQGVSDRAHPDLGVKIGLNAGEPIAEEDDLYGTAVQIAARVTDQAGAGEIVCTNVVRELVAGKSYLFNEREPASLKGVEEPVRLFEVSYGDRE